MEQPGWVQILNFSAFTSFKCWLFEHERIKTMDGLWIKWHSQSLWNLFPLQELNNLWTGLPRPESLGDSVPPCCVLLHFTRRDISDRGSRLSFLFEPDRVWEGGNWARPEPDAVNVSWSDELLPWLHLAYLPRWHVWAPCIWEIKVIVSCR